MIAALLCTATLFGQNILKVKVINTETKEPLANASIVSKGIENLPVTNNDGEAKFILPAREVILFISYIGYETKEVRVTIPFNDTLVLVEMKLKEEEEEEVIIQSTRSSRTIQDIPTRVEFIAGEELDEKANMKPGDIRMVLTESTGIQTQQTSATSANASIRIDRKRLL